MSEVMTQNPSTEERILERLEAMEERLAILQAKAEAKNSFFEILPPVTADAFQVMVQNFQILHGRVELEDFMEFGKRTALSVPNLTWLLGGLESLRNMINIITPEITPTFQTLLAATANMEANGTFAKLGAAKGAAGTIAGSLSPEDIEKAGQSLAFLVKLLTELSDPKVQASILTLVDIAKSIDLSKSQPVGMFGLLAALNDPDTKKVLGAATTAFKQVGAKL